MNELCMMIKKQAEINFINMDIALKTYDREAEVCGAPAWRYVYHTLHSADKWFFNPEVYEEPEFQEPGMDNPDRPCTVVLSDDQLKDYLEHIRRKTAEYLDSLDDSMLYERPENCEFTRLELVLMQFRHFSLHVGMLHGQTVERTDRFPRYAGANIPDLEKDGYFC